MKIELKFYWFCEILLADLLLLNLLKSFTTLELEREHRICVKDHG